MIKKFFYERMGYRQFIEVEDGKIKKMECTCGEEDCKHLKMIKVWIGLKKL